MKNFNTFTFFNQLTAMPKRLAMVLTVLFTLGVGSVLGTSYISYNGSTQDESTTISSTNVSNGSAGAISWQGTSCTYSSDRVNISANGSITFSVSGENMITKIVVTSGSSSSYYGTWTSTSGSVSSSSGTTTISDINAASVTIKTSTAFRCTSASSIKIYYDAASSGGAGDDCNVTYDFTKINFTGWSNSYAQHIVEYEDATVTFKAASKQASTITDQPVTKGNEVSLVMKEGNTLSSVTWVCKQWSSKTQTITLHYSTDGGKSYTSTNITSTNFQISSDNLPTGTNAVKITFSSSSNQVGITSCSIEKVCNAGTTYTLTNTVSPDGYGTISPSSVEDIPKGTTTSKNANTYTVNGTTVTASPSAKTTQYTYEFSEWQNLPATVNGDATVTAVFTRTTNKYTITWKNADGTPLKTEEVAYGTTPSYTGTTPTKAATAQYTYTHNGWTPSVVAVTGNAEYTATFAATPRTYTINLNTNGGTIKAGNVTSYKYGTGATLPTNVTKEHHQFGGWFDNSGCTGTAVTTISTTATGDKEYWAKWTELPKYTVTWSVDGNTTTEEVYSGDKATKAPTIEENNLPCDGADKFVGWTTDAIPTPQDGAPSYFTEAANSPAITGDVTFYAVFADYKD